MKYAQQTNAIHYKNFEPMKSRPLNTPIFQTSTFYFNNFKQIDDIFSLKERDFVYTRGGNPNVNLLEQRLAVLEKGVDAVCFGSGMGAISTTLFSLLKPTDTIIVSDVLYGSAFSFITNILGSLGIKVLVHDFNDLKGLESNIKKYKPTVIYFETPCNPTLKLIDIEKVSNLSHRFNASVVVDNTFATPFLQNPLEFGADIVLHSLTKYINGHGDALGGVVIAKNQGYIDKLKFAYMCELGTVMDPHSAYLITRGLKTLTLRMEKHQDNARKVAKFLISRSEVEKVIYPGLQNYKWREIRNKQMKGDGGVISFYLKDTSVNRVKKFVERLNLFKLAVSLGDTESLVEYPLYMTHREYLNDSGSETYRELKTLVRLSIGLEDSTDLINDLEQAFKSLT